MGGYTLQDTEVRPVSLAFLFWTFLKVGATAFGGFMALIAVVQSLIVERHRLLKAEEMLDGISLASLIPGPVAVNVVSYTGYRLRGGLGALVSSTAVILPSFVLIVALSYAYLRWGQIPVVNKLFMGFIPAVTAIIFVAGYGLARKAVTGWREGVIMAAAAALLLGVGGFFITLGIIVGAGIAGWLMFRPRTQKKEDDDDTVKLPGENKPARPRDSSAYALVPLMAPLASFDTGLLGKLFAVFAGMSLMLFGGGYVFIPLIQEIVVDGYGWVTHQEFVDAIAMGQITPGPILISAAFIGLKVGGLAGALVATVAIFLPPALVMIAASRALERIKRSAAIKAALQGVRPAVVGLVFAACFVVGKTAPLNWISGLILAAALLALMRFRIEVVWVIPVAGLTGLLMY